MSSTSSFSYPRCRKKKKKVNQKKKKITIPYQVKSGDIRLPSWPTTTAFPVWRRTLRQAVICASDRPECARPWIFAVESDDIVIDDGACADDDRHRTLDAKLTHALIETLKHESAMKMALAADMLSGRQSLLLIYHKFKRTETKFYAAAYANLESNRRGSGSRSLRSFITI